MTPQTPPGGLLVDGFGGAEAPPSRNHPYILGSKTVLNKFFAPQEGGQVAKRQNGLA